MINQNVHRLMIQPAHVVQPAAMIAKALQAAVDGTVNEPAAATLAASLSLLPRTMWHEYEFGTGGKPACNFTPSKQGGKNKFTYYHCRVVWDAVDILVHAGWTAKAACNHIYEIYNRKQSVTNIIKTMLDNPKTGGHPNLQMHNL